MFRTLVIGLFIVLSFAIASAQKTNDAIAKQIKQLKVEKSVTLSFDGNSSKVMAIGENFAESEAKAVGIQAMNFGMAFFYAGKDLTTSPETINLTFWVMSKKPKLAAAHAWSYDFADGRSDGKLDLGDAVYAAKPGQNMEYLNFKLTRKDLNRITTNPTAKFHLGTANFTFTPAQITTLKAMLDISDVR